jgi:hypothetical protein
VILWNRSPGLGITEDWFSTAQYFDSKTEHYGFEGAAIAIGGNENLRDDGKPERAGTFNVKIKIKIKIKVKVKVKGAGNGVRLTLRFDAAKSQDESRCGDLRRARSVLAVSKVRARNRDEARGCRRKA